MTSTDEPKMAVTRVRAAVDLTGEQSAGLNALARTDEET